MFVHPYSWEWREAQSTDGNMGRRPMSYRVWNSHDWCSDLRIFLTSFHFGPHPQPHNEAAQTGSGGSWCGPLEAEITRGTHKLLSNFSSSSVAPTVTIPHMDFTKAS